MKDSRSSRSIFALVWIAACLAAIVGGAAAGIHFALGLGRLILNPSHRWQPRSDWIACFLWAVAAAAVAALPTIWRLRRNRLRKLKQPQPAPPESGEPQTPLHQPSQTEPAWKN